MPNSVKHLYVLHIWNFPRCLSEKCMPRNLPWFYLKQALCKYVLERIYYDLSKGLQPCMLLILMVWKCHSPQATHNKNINTSSERMDSSRSSSGVWATSREVISQRPFKKFCFKRTQWWLGNWEQFLCFVR